MSLFKNVRLFYILGAAALLLGLIPGLLLTQTGPNPAGEDFDVAVPTPNFSSPTPEGQESTATPGPTLTATPARQYTSPPPMTIDPARQYFAVITTDKGDIRIELASAAAPQTVNNFVFLAREGFYNGLLFHRVIPGFVAQSGDPTGTGAGGPGYTLPLESSGLSHEAGVIAMAATGGQTLSGSQFYITYSSLTSQDGRDTVFGRVVSGIEVLQQLTPRCDNPNQAAGCQATPADPSSLSRIVSITIEEVAG